MRLLIKFPSRERPEQFFAALRQYAALCHDKAETRFLFTFDTCDTTMQDAHAHVREACDGIGFTIRYGARAGKIEAVNRDLDTYTATQPWDILLVASDDMIPVAQGYDRRIRQAMREEFPDTDGLVWLNDGRQQRIATVAAMGRKWYDRFGYFYHPEYQSLWADNEQTDVARDAGKLAFVPEVIIRNESPDWGGYIPVDRLYQVNNRHYVSDRKVYLRRRANQFPR